MESIKFQIKDKNIQLRSFKKSDLEDLVTHANNTNISKFMTNKFPHPYTKQDGMQFIKHATSTKGNHKIFAIVIDGEVCGGIGLHPQDDVFQYNAELGYWVGEKYWGHGIVTEAIKHMVNYGFTNMKIKRIFARPFSNNPGSKRVLEKAGLNHEATLKATVHKNGEVLDELIYSIHKF